MLNNNLFGWGISLKCNVSAVYQKNIYSIFTSLHETLTETIAPTPLPNQLYF